ncbi:MAG: protein kinase [Deltaproteobacteria bacterium]|nr:protein kinase [Deltaproteobacteria bacterium]
MARCVTCHRRLAAGLACPEHGGVAASAEVGEPGAPFQWERPVGTLLGSGGFASVWDLGATVLKVAHADHELARARMAREAEALGTIGAPSVPRLAGHGVLYGGRAWIEMEKIVGTSITALTYGGALGTDRAVSTVLAALTALGRVHAAGFIHRDIKPDNMYRRDDGSVVILDLGLARKTPSDPEDPTRANVQVGSLEYMPPEQLIDAASVTVRSDLYAIACVLFELCAGRPPFVGDAAALERAHAALRPPRLGGMASVPVALEGICADCLAKDPTKRPRDTEDLRARLRATRDTPTMMRTAPALSQIAESRQPVVLVWIELARVDRAVLATLAARHVIIVSQRGRRILVALLGSAHADPATVALQLARDLADGGARVALHLDALQLDGTGAAPVLRGEGVEKPESWLPVATWTGVILTRAIAAVTQVATRPADDAGPGFRFLVEGGGRAELFGRDALLTDLAADAAAAVHGIPPQEHRSGSGTWGPAGPAFAVLTGDAGVGKTAFAAELARRLGDLGARVHFAAVPAPGSGKSPPLAALIGIPEGPPVRAIGDALRAAARSKPTVVILDDLHLADHALLDALEYATLGGEALPLWVLGIGSSRLDARRPNLGAHAERHRKSVLGVLDEDAAVQMTAALLEPAEYPPLRALRQLVGLARANPLHLTMLAREIHERGAIRTRSGGEYFLDTTALDKLEPIALGPWLAARELAELSRELVALARVCAVLGDEVQRDALHAILDTVERAGGATTAIDVDIGLCELTAAQLLDAGDRRWTFRSGLLQEGIYTTTNEAERAVIHRAALEHWSTSPLDAPGVAERIARHAEAVGEAERAAAAFAWIAEEAHKGHRALDADQAWQGAVRNLPGEDPRRGRALLGRARARYKLQRINDAVVDLDAAIAIAIAHGDARLEIEALLEKATAHDWAEDFAASAAAAKRATELLATHPIPELAVEADLALGRSAWRAREFDRAAPLLTSVVERARTYGRHDAEIIATLLSATLAVDIGAFDRAAAEFETLIPLCEARDDRFHLGAAYTNRSWLWSASGQVERCAEDLRQVIQIAREIGQAILERVATYNLAESLLWAGSLEGALVAARRSLNLQKGYGEGAANFDQVLVARILAARGEVVELKATLDGIATAGLAPPEQAIIRVLRCVCDGASPSEWEAALSPANELLGIDHKIELAHLAYTAGALGPERITELKNWIAAHPVWSRRSVPPTGRENN